MKNIFYFILTIVVLLAIGIGGFSLYKNFDTVKSWFQKSEEKDEDTYDENYNPIDYDLTEEQIETLRGRINYTSSVNATNLVYLKYNDETNFLDCFFEGTRSGEDCWFYVGNSAEKELLTPEYIIETVFAGPRLSSSYFKSVKDYRGGASYYEANKDNKYEIKNINCKLDDFKINIYTRDSQSDMEKKSCIVYYQILVVKNNQLKCYLLNQTYSENYPVENSDTELPLTERVNWDNICKDVLDQFKI